MSFQIEGCPSRAGFAIWRLGVLVAVCAEKAVRAIFAPGPEAEAVVELVGRLLARPAAAA